KSLRQGRDCPSIKSTARQISCNTLDLYHYQLIYIDKLSQQEKAVSHRAANNRFAHNSDES
ncbi:MAG TPA: hypothetical protein VG271_06310, partial [Beijerinckiaceae bacterium]|nr:hypothetical protein [Beijerinckiaceae bacterium]